MAKINGNEIRPGNVIEHDGGLWVAVRTNTVKPGKGGAYNQVELKNLINGTKLNERFRSAETVESIQLEKKDFSFLYEQGEALIFMDTTSYEQLELQKEFVGDRAAFLQDGMMVTVQLYGERPIGIALPDQVTLTITEADPVVKGQTAASSYKPAILENGIRVLVPPFIGVGRAHRRRHQRNHLSAPRRLSVARSPVDREHDRRLTTNEPRDSHGPFALLNVMVQAAMKAGRSLSRDFGEVQNLQVSLKGPSDFVSQADRKAEEIVFAELSQGAAGLSLPDGRARRRCRRGRPAPLDRRSARRHHQLPARPADVLPSRSRWNGRARSSPASSTIRPWTSSTPPSAAAAPS